MVRILSLDILAGVFCGYHFARLILDCDCPPFTPVILCLTVWLRSDTLDHLLDARSLKENSIKPVYRWHWDHRFIIQPVLLLVGLATIGLSMVYLSTGILLFGGEHYREPCDIIHHCPSGETGYPQEVPV